MDMIKREPQLERLICEKTVQFETEGALPSPDGRGVRSVLTSDARVVIAESASEEGQVRIAGRIEVSVLAQDDEGTAFSFESYAGFTQIIPVEEAAPQMIARVMASVQELEVSPKEDGAYMKASIDIALMLSSCVPIAVFGGVNGASDVETREFRGVHASSKLVGRTSLRLREELPSEGAARVVSSCGTVFVRDFSQSSEGAFVSGAVTVSAAVTDADGRLFQLVKQIPFREMLDMEADTEGAYCEARLKRLYLRTVGEGFDLISMEAELEMTLRRMERNELILPLDAFSPSCPFECVREKVAVLNAAGQGSSQTVIKENLALPDTAPDMAQPLYASARPIVTDTVIDGGTLRASGVLMTDVVYESTGGNINIVGFETPFGISVEAEGADRARVFASCTAFAPACSERNVQLQYSLAVECELWSVNEVEAAVGIEETEPPERRSGIAVCFTSDGETVFDIAKRYSLPCSLVREMCPDTEEPFGEGDKLMLIL